MCEQCLVNPLYYGEIIPGWHLIRARRKSSEMNVGDWGLLRCNDPDIIWSTMPSKEIEYPPNDFCDGLYLTADLGYELVIAAIQSGYNPEMDGLFSYWLWDKITNHIKNTTPTTQDDPFPHLDQTQEHDYTL